MSQEYRTVTRYVAEAGDIYRVSVHDVTGIEAREQIAIVPPNIARIIVDELNERVGERDRAIERHTNFIASLTEPPEAEQVSLGKPSEDGALSTSLNDPSA